MREEERSVREGGRSVREEGRSHSLSLRAAELPHNRCVLVVCSYNKRNSYMMTLNLGL